MTTTLTPQDTPVPSPALDAADAPDAAEAAGAAQVAAAVEGAADAARGWRRTSPGDRAAALREAAAQVRAHADDLAGALCDTTGKLLRDARGSALVAAELLDEAAVTGLGATGRTLAGGSGALDWVRAEPRGVVAVLTPWNDPYPAAAGLLAAALVTGNTVVHKPSERSLEPGLQLARLVAGCLPDGVLQLLSGDGAVGALLVQDPRVDVVAHVGSSATGAWIRQQCAARGAKAIVENGGKDALLVDAGVDPRWAAEQIAIGAFTNAGQLCTSVERVYLHEAVADAVLEELVRVAEELRPGDPRAPETTLCRLVDERQLHVVEQQVESALEAGASALTGARRLDLPGAWYAPTVLTGCRPGMAVMDEETFGPVAPVMRVPSWQEALWEADSGRYGLAATVLTADPQHAMEAVEVLDVGTVKVNAVFGGAPGGSADPRRASGQGRGYGPDLLGELTQLKAVHWEPVSSELRDG
ncbi:aldehyde dehydrogenase family protein [Pedococcus sp. 5OH_020]|uniref:aldehyde dehydrogenase family protein n=1 Tax=Pedococcus sp. 5OH_020 TaxID=2989814 RepID=UPI0022E9DE34|nr:aldehyde dehydrogenase family protein [Pedococcus sp. 5OH_020]